MDTTVRTKLLGCVLLCLFTCPAFGQAVWEQYSGPYAGEVGAFATYGDTIFAGSRLTGVFKSTDGKNWTATLPELTYVHSLHNSDTALFIGTNKLFSYTKPGNPLIQLGQEVPGAISYIYDFNGTLFITSDHGVYKYEPSSNEFVLKNNGLTAYDYSIYWTRDLAAIDDVLFCNVIASGIYKSTDQGEHWEKVDVSGYGYGFGFMVGHGDSLFCGGAGNLYVSDDKGETWTDIKYDLPTGNLFVSKLEIFNSSIFISTYTGIYTMPKGGSHWVKVSDRTFDALINDGTTFLASNKNGVYRWDEVHNEFVLSNTGINTSRVNGIEVFNHKIYSATESGVHFTASDGDEWSIVTELDGIYTKSIAKSDTSLFAGTSQGLYATSESTPNWSMCTNGISDAAIWDIEVNGNKIFVGTDEGLFVSYNDGKNWKLLYNSQSLHDQVLYVGVNDSVLIAGNNTGLYKILPDSSDWEIVAFFRDKEMHSINIIEEVIYASYVNSAIYRSLDYGQTWSSTNMPARSKVDMIKRGDNVYASDFHNILSSADNGTTWDFWSETGIPEINLTCITEGDNAFYTGTYGKSIWRRPFLSLTNISSEIYEIGDSFIYDIPENTTLEDFRSNVTLGYGTSLEVNKAESSIGRTKETAVIAEGDQIKIIAEDRTTFRVLTVAKKGAEEEEEEEEVVTSVEETDSEALTIFPIPSKGALYVNDPGQIKSYAISDSRGKIISRRSLGIDNIDISDLPSGFYLLLIQKHSNKRQVLKFIKE